MGVRTGRKAGREACGAPKRLHMAGRSAKGRPCLSPTAAARGNAAAALFDYTGLDTKEIILHSCRIGTVGSSGEIFRAWPKVPCVRYVAPAAYPSPPERGRGVYRTDTVALGGEARSPLRSGAGKTALAAAAEEARFPRDRPGGKGEGLRGKAQRPFPVCLENGLLWAGTCGACPIPRAAGSAV